MPQNVARKARDGKKLCKSEFARTHSMFCEATGEIREINCKSPTCPRHAGKWLHKWKVVVSRELEANPVNKLITLTCASKATPQQLTLARQLFFEQVRKHYGQFEYLSVLEFTSETRLPHMHILARGRYIHQKRLSKLWASATESSGITPSPVVYIEAPRSQQAGAFYALSYALDDHKKGQSLPADWRGRKITYSKGFFTIGTAKQIWQAYIKETFSGSSDDPAFFLADFTIDGCLEDIDVSRET